MSKEVNHGGGGGGIKHCMSCLISSENASHPAWNGNLHISRICIFHIFFLIFLYCNSLIEAFVSVGVN